MATISSILGGITAIRVVRNPTYATADNWDTAPLTEFETLTPVDCGALGAEAVFSYDSKGEDVYCEQDTAPLKFLLTEEEVKVKVSLLESSFVNLNLAMCGTPTTASDQVFVGQGSGSAGGSTVNHYALDIKTTGLTSAKLVRHIVLPKVIQTGGVSISYGKGKTQMVEIEFKAYRAQESDSAFLFLPLALIIDAAT
jgi:hypothetical protein